MTLDNALTSEIFLRACNQYLRNIVLEYCQLSVRDTLTDAQSVTIASILKQAEDDPMLSFLLDEADHVIGHQLGLVNVSKIQAEQIDLQQILDQTWIDWLVTKVGSSDVALLSEHVLKQAQTRLKKHGLYTAEIDGICGAETKKAIQRLEQNFHSQLRGSNFYPDLIGPGKEIKTKEAIRLVHTQGMTGDIKEKADLLSLVVGDLSPC